MRRSWMYLIAVLIPLLTFAQAWEANVIDGNYYSPNQIQSADMDGDGDMDVISVGGNGNENITWWEHTVEGNEIVWVEHTVTSTFEGVMSIQCVDVDLDGDLDAVATADYPTLMVAWWENVDGDGLNWTQWVITDALREANGRMVGMADMDGDGDNDAVIAHWYADHKIYWMENIDGAGHTWVEHIILQFASLPGRVRIADFDNDEDLDFTLVNEDRLDWWRNDNGDASSWTQNNIDPQQSYGWLSGIEVEDMNGDSNMDIVFAKTYEDQILWWENDSTGTMWTQHLITDAIDHPYTFDTGDIDNDGDIDLAVVASFNGDVYWFKNVDGFGETWASFQIADGFFFTQDVDIADIDADGLQDVVVAYSGTSTGINWYRQVYNNPVVLTLTPTSSTTIPAGGGSLMFNAQLVSQSDRPFWNVSFWTEVTMPSGRTFGPLYLRRFTLPSDTVVFAHGLAQSIPVFAPAGDYLLTGYAGYRRGGPAVIDAFEFNKVAGEIDGAIVNDWSAKGEWALADASETPDLPQKYTLTNAWPNPFNASTSLTVTLPETSELTINVFNTMGQQVATITDGIASAGSHTYTFDASKLASGLYFIHANVPGQFNQVQKVMLVR